MKKILLLVPVVLLLAAACDKQPTTQQNSQGFKNLTNAEATKTYSDSRYGVSFDYPETWTIEDEGSIVRLITPAQNGKFLTKLEISFNPWQESPEYYSYTDFVQDKTLGANIWKVRKIVAGKPNEGTLVYVTDRVGQIVIVATAYDNTPNADLNYGVQMSQPFTKLTENILKSFIISTSQSSNFEVFSNGKYGYEISLPKTWKAYSEYDGKTIASRPSQFPNNPTVLTGLLPNIDFQIEFQKGLTLGSAEKLLPQGTIFVSTITLKDDQQGKKYILGSSVFFLVESSGGMLGEGSKGTVKIYSSKAFPDLDKILSSILINVSR